MAGEAICDDRKDARIILGKRRSARRRATHLDFRIRLAAESLDDDDVAPAQPIFPF